LAKLPSYGGRLPSFKKLFISFTATLGLYLFILIRYTPDTEQQFKAELASNPALSLGLDGLFITTLVLLGLLSAKLLAWLILEKPLTIREKENHA